MNTLVSGNVQPMEVYGSSHKYGLCSKVVDSCIASILVTDLVIGVREFGEVGDHTAN